MIHQWKQENPFPDLADLAQQADEAIASGRAPAWQIDGEGPSMRSSVRVDDNSHHLSWVQGVTPATLPPPMPLHQGECHWVMAWNNMVTTNNAIVRHPARQNIEPTIVIYKTLAGQPSRGVLPDHAQLTIHPAGAWIATTALNWGSLARLDFGSWWWTTPPLQRLATCSCRLERVSG